MMVRKLLNWNVTKNKLILESFCIPSMLVTHQNILIHTPDTDDAIVLAIFECRVLKISIYVKIGSKNKISILSNRILQKITKKVWSKRSWTSCCFYCGTLCIYWMRQSKCLLEKSENMTSSFGVKKARIYQVF